MAFVYPTIIDRVQAAPVSELPVSVLVPSVVLEPISYYLVAYNVFYGLTLYVPPSGTVSLLLL
jgi:hypothetical protein